jgi:hypothetical protein
VLDFEINVKLKNAVIIHFINKNNRLYKLEDNKIYCLKEDMPNCLQSPICFGPGVPNSKMKGA